MTTKQLYVSSAVQKALLEDVLIPEMATGFWKDHRPADHAAQWADVEIVITDSDKLGPVNFTIPRLYNFVNPDFIKPNEQKLVDCAMKAKSTSNFRSVKKELIELSRIVGGRLTDKNAVPTKANRGNNKAGMVQETVKKAKTAVKKATTAVKKTVVKKPTTTKKGSTTVKRTPVVKADEPTAGDDASQSEAVETIQQEPVMATPTVVDALQPGDHTTVQEVTITTTTHVEPAHEAEPKAE